MFEKAKFNQNTMMDFQGHPKRYLVVVRTDDDRDMQIYTSYIDRNDSTKELIIEGLTFNENMLLDIHDCLEVQIA